MYLLWEGDTAPSGWEIDHTHDNRMLRGGDTYVDGNDSHEILAATGGASGNTHSSYYGYDKSCYNGNQHTHNGYTSQSTTFPPHRTIRLIKTASLYGVLPAGVVGFGQSVLSGWEAQTDYANKYILLKNQTPIDGGSASHTHTPPANTSIGGNNSTVCGFTATPRIKSNHTHAVSGTIDAANAEPYWFGMAVLKLLNNQSTAIGLIAMFDEVPPVDAGWECISIPERFIKQAAYGTLGGNPTHSHSHNLTSDVGSYDSQGAHADSNWYNVTRGLGHTHVLSLSDADYNPPYAQFIFAKYTGPMHIGDNVLCIPHDGTYSRAAIKGKDPVQVGDKVRLYPYRGGGKVAIKESWITGNTITIKKDNV